MCVCVWYVYSVHEPDVCCRNKGSGGGGGGDDSSDEADSEKDSRKKALDSMCCVGLIQYCY